MGYVDQAENNQCEFIAFHLHYFSVDQSIRLQRVVLYVDVFEYEDMRYFIMGQGIMVGFLISAEAYQYLGAVE